MINWPYEEAGGQIGEHDADLALHAATTGRPSRIYGAACPFH